MAPYKETAIVGASYELWSDEFLLGTDNIGRDMLTRLIYGARNTIGIAFVTVSLAFLVGGVMGMLAAILGGWYDMIISRVVDILMAIPSLVFALLLLTVFGTSIPSLVIIIALLDSTRVFRISRSRRHECGRHGILLKRHDFVERHGMGNRKSSAEYHGAVTC